MFNSFEQMKNNAPAAADILTTVAAGVLTQVERDEMAKPREQRKSGDEKKAVVFSETEKALLRLFKTTSVYFAGPVKPLVDMGAEIVFHHLEEAIEDAFQKLGLLGIVNWGQKPGADN